MSPGIDHEKQLTSGSVYTYQGPTVIGIRQSSLIHHPRKNIEYLTMGEMRSEPPADKIDTHHHFVPEFYAQGIH